MFTKLEQGKPTVLTMGGRQLTKSWFSHIIKMQGDTTCVSVADTDNFGLGIMLWGHRRRGVYSTPFSFLGKTVMKELSIFIEKSGNFCDIVNRTGE